MRDCVDCITLAEDSYHWPSHLNDEINLRVTRNAGGSLASDQLLACQLSLSSMELIINVCGSTLLLESFDGIAWRQVTCLSKTGKEMNLFITLILQNTRIYKT